MGSPPKPRPVPIGQVFTLDQIVAAYRCMEENKAERLGMGGPGDLNHLLYRQRKSGRGGGHYYKPTLKRIPLAFTRSVFPLESPPTPSAALRVKAVFQLFGSAPLPKGPKISAEKTSIDKENFVVTVGSKVFIPLS